MWRTTPEDAKEVIDTNLTGALATILPLLPLMRERGRGHVVGMSSLAADLTQPMAAVYGASKSALTYFLDSVAPELEQMGITVTIVHPGFVTYRTEQGYNFHFDMLKLGRVQFDLMNFR